MKGGKLLWKLLKTDITNMYQQKKSRLVKINVFTKAYFLGEFVGYRAKTKTKQLVKGVEKSVGFQFKPCKKVYEDINGNLRFILC